MTDIFILGGHQTDFSRNWHKADLSLVDMIQESIYGAVEATNIDINDIQSCHISNFNGELFLGQGIFGGVVAEAIPELRGIPMQRHEAACASGSMALLSAIADIKAGFHDAVCVLGLEYMRNVDGKTAAGYLASAAWAGHEAQDTDFCWPYMFSQVHDEYEKRYGINRDHLNAIAENNFSNAKLNPNSQSRKWAFDQAAFTDSDEFNPVVEGNVRRQDCSQITDGASTVILVNEAYAKAYASSNNIDINNIPRIKGWGHTSSRISYQDKVRDSANDQRIFPHVEKAIQDAWKLASINNVWELDGIETHDCFTVSEYMAIDHFGLVEPGQSWQAIENEWIKLGNKLPFNASGGLIGCGHPVGATGIRMVLDAWKQTTNQAGDYQIDNAKNIGTLNLGGSTTAVVSFVVGL